MGAGEDDDVDPVASWLEHWLPAARTASTPISSPASLASASIDQLGRAVADDGAVGGEAGGEVVDIGLAHRGLGPEHADTRDFDISDAGLIAGTVPTTGRSSAARTGRARWSRRCCRRSLPAAGWKRSATGASRAGTRAAMSSSLRVP